MCVLHKYYTHIYTCRSSSLSLHSLSNLHPPIPTSPKVTLPQQLQNIMVQRETECYHSSGTVTLEDAIHYDEHRVHVTVANSWKQLTTYVVKTVTDSEEEDVNQSA